MADGTAVQMPYWPARSLRGQVQFADGEAAQEIRAQIESAEPKIRGEVTCPVKGSKWSCHVPDAILDVKLTAPAFAPVYRWAVHPARTLNVVFERGPSLTGTVVESDGTPVVQGSVQVEAEQYARDPTELVPQRGWSAAIGPRGFFQVRGFPSGLYRLSVRAPRKTPTVLRNLRVESDEMLLRDPLVLRSLATLDVAVTPPVDSEGRPWRLRMGRREGEGTLVPAGEITTDSAGHAMFSGLERGEYRLHLQDSRGGTVLRRTVDIDREQVSLPLTVDRVEIDGRVRLGARAVAAELRFSSETSSVRMHSDDEGRFLGDLPHAGTWTVDVKTEDSASVTTTVAVEQPDGRAYVDVDLPGTHMGGLVVDGGNRPVETAQVLVFRQGRLEAATTSRRDGTFDIAGVPEGPVRLQARSAAGDSEPIIHEVGSGAEVRLVIEARASRPRHLMDRSGAGISGALIRYSAGGRALETPSGPRGEFTLELPVSVSHVDIAILAPGYPVTIATIDVSGSEPIILDRNAGRLAIALGSAPPWPTVIRGTARFLLPRMFRPRSRVGPPDEVIDGAFALDVAPGTYSVCLSSAQCRTVSIVAGAVVRVSLDSPPEAMR